MKKKRTIKGVAIIMLLLSMLGLAGCTKDTEKQMDKDNAKAIEFLNKKYNKEFKISEDIHEVASIGGNAARLRQGRAYYVDKQEETFWVYVDSNNDEVYGDTYQNITMRPYAQEYYEKIMKNNWTHCKTDVELECMATKEQVYSKENYETYLTNEGGSASVMVFIQSSGDNTQKEAEDIYLFTKQIKDMGLKGDFTYIYMKDNSNLSKEKMKDIKKSMNSYIKDGIVLRACLVFINKLDNLDINEIKKDLDEKEY
ncbi:MAG: hypothetical protein ACM3X7_06090 [Solirubrobacterales bacterium]